MNCIIIEDEQSASENLERQLARTGFTIDVAARIDSIEEAVPWLKSNQTDLIFLDIQLGDGLSFEIFDHVQVQTPVIFTTSFDEYAIKAFELNSISYLFKPIRLDKLKSALEKFQLLHGNNQAINQKIINLYTKYQTRFLVRVGNSYKPIAVEDVAYVYIQNKHFLFIVTRDKQQYLYDSTMEILEQRLDPEKFFRINRFFMISYDAIKSLEKEKDRIRLETNPEYKEELMVSIHRATAFKNWLDR